MLRARLVCISILLLAALGIVQAQDPPPPNKTDLTITKWTKPGTGPYSLDFEATASLDNTTKGCKGFSYFVQPNPNSGQYFVGFTTTPKGLPMPGGPAVPVTGTTGLILPKGEYFTTVTMLYIDKDGKDQKVEKKEIVKVP